MDKFGFVEEKILDELVDIYLGLTHTPEYVEKGIPFLSVKNISNGFIDFDECNYISEDEFNLLPSGAKPQIGDMLFCRVGTLGKPIIIPEGTPEFGSFVSLGFLRNKSEVDIKYLYYWMYSRNFWMQVESNVKGASQVNLNTGWLKKFSIKVYDKETELKVISKLDSLNRIISKRKSQLEELDTLIKARFVEMFGDPKLNEKGWDDAVISDLFEVKGGKRIPKGMGYSDIVTNHPYLRATDMKNETILDDDIHYIEEDVFDCIKRYTVKGGDIYLTNVGVNLGMAGVIPDRYDGASLTENAVKLVPKKEGIVDGLFLAHYINSPGIQDYINERKMSVGVPKLAIFRIETMPLLLPPIELQKEFNTFVEQVGKLKLEVQKSLDELQTLFDSLMQEYFG